MPTYSDKFSLVFLFILFTNPCISYTSPTLARCSDRENPVSMQEKPMNICYTKLHILHNNSQSTIYVGFYIHDKQVPYATGMKNSPDNPIATIAAGGQLKLHIPYQYGLLKHTYPTIYYSHDHLALTSSARTTAPLVGNNMWHYGSKKTLWKRDISFIHDGNQISLHEKTPQEVALEKEIQNPIAQIKPYKPYTFENTLEKPIYAAFYICNHRVSYYDHRNNKSTKNHILTINPKTKETITIPYISNWLNNDYPVIYFSTDSSDLPDTLSALTHNNTYNLNQETWGYFTFFQDAYSKEIVLRSTHVSGIKAALANSSSYTLHNNTDAVIHFDLYYKTDDGSFKSMTTLGDKQYTLNAIRGRHYKVFKVPALKTIRLYVTRDQHLLSENIPATHHSSKINYYEFSHQLKAFYGSIIINYDGHKNLELSRDIHHLSDKTAYLIKSSLTMPINTLLATKKIGTALIQGIWYKNIIKSLLKVGTDHQINHYQKKCSHETQKAEASIDSSAGLSDEEHQYLVSHAPHEIIGGCPPVRIALCSSGGGYRAMIGALGFFDGIQRIDLMKNVTYNAGLSGGSWALAAWQASQEPKVETYKNALFSRASRFLNHELYDQNESEIKKLVSQAIRDKVLYPDTPFSIISPFGSIIGQRILINAHPENMHLANNKKQCPNKPLCLHAAIVPQRDLSINGTGFQWIEFSPYHVNFINYTGIGRIPLWSFGRHFDITQKKSINYTPPYSLPFCLGMWGSALSVSIQELTSQDSVQSQILPLLQYVQSNLNSAYLAKDKQVEAFAVNSEKIQELINLALDSDHYKQLEKYEVFSNGRFRPARIASWVPSTQEFLTIVDAAIEFNLPLPLLLLPERNVDVIIINDTSGDLHTAGAGELQKALRYAKNSYGFEYMIPGETSADLLADKALSTEYLLSLLKKYNRPYIILEPKNSACNKNLSNNKNPHIAPFIIYVPLLDHNSLIQPTETFVTPKFAYSKQEAETLYNIMRDKIDIRIIEEIKKFSKNKNKKSRG